MKIKLKLIKSAAEEKKKSTKIVIKKKGMKMVTSSYYIPKEQKKKPLGEDAHFVRAEEETIGVADGVGGWAKHGIDSGEFARALMHNSGEAISKNSVTDPKKILEEAFSRTGAHIRGASTACILTHKDGTLRSANVGDSGYVVLRDGKVFHRSLTQQRRFNCPFQLGHHRSSDRPDSAAVAQLPVAPGDVVVLCTDGVLDNMYDSDFEAAAAAATMAEELALRIAQMAHSKSLDKNFLSPFERDSAIHGHHHKGGKPDDITVVVAKIVTHYDIHLRD